MGLESVVWCVFSWCWRTVGSWDNKCCFKDSLLQVVTGFVLVVMVVGVVV